MGIYYPQAAMTLRILWEDFNFKSDASLQKVYSLPILAKSVTVNINDYNTADTFSAEIDYKSFPFDPRCIRSCGVTIHMQDVKKTYQGNNALNLLTPSEANTVFLGFADEESISFDESNRTVRLEGRDLTCLLIDKKYSRGPLALTDSLDKVLQGLLDDLKETQPLKLEIRPADLEMPILASVGANPKAAVANHDRDDTYWEVIQNVVSRSGLICFIELDKLVLTRPRALYNASNAKVFVYGNNLKSLEFKRKIGRKKFFNVIIRSLVGKEVIEAKIPAEATEEWSKATGIDRTEVKMPEVGPKGEQIPIEKWKPAPYISFRIPDCIDKDQLIKYAQEVYEEIGRQQIEGSFSTKEMETTTLAGKCFDLLQLRNGTPVQITIDQGDLKGLSEMTDKNEETLIARRRRYLELRGYEPSIAAALAKSMGKFANVFYTKAVTFTLDNDNGFEAKVEFLNFIDSKVQQPKGN